jgi:hypothetical protein
MLGYWLQRWPDGLPHLRNCCICHRRVGSAEHQEISQSLVVAFILDTKTQLIDSSYRELGNFFAVPTQNGKRDSLWKVSCKRFGFRSSHRELHRARAENHNDEIIALQICTFIRAVLLNQKMILRATSGVEMASCRLE